MVAFAVGHIGATLLVAVGLTAAVKLGWLPVSITRAEDVGMSYGATAVLGTLTGAVPGRWRAVLDRRVAGGRGRPSLWVTSDFTDVGHVVALVLGMAVATRFGKPGPWTATRVVLLAVGAPFGFLILANTAPLMVVATICGACRSHARCPGELVAAVDAPRPRGSCAGDGIVSQDSRGTPRPGGWRVTVILSRSMTALGEAPGRDGQRNSSADASIQSESHDSGGSSSNSPGISQS